MIKRSSLKSFPVGFIGTCLGLGTLANVYNILGYSWIRHISMWIVGLAVVLGILKTILFFPKVKEEYKNTILASMFTTITMCAMLFGSYLISYAPHAGKAIFFAGVFVHIAMIVLFVIYHIIMKYDYNLMLPCYYVTYNGLLVSTVAGATILPPAITMWITYYGIGIYLLILIFMVARIIKDPVPDDVVHTKMVLLAPCSLCLASYINFSQVASLQSLLNPTVVIVMYAFVFVTLIYVMTHIFKFFSRPFTPLFGALTFPMAIGTLAALRAGQYFSSIETYKTLGFFVNNIVGFQIFVSTTFIAIVFFNFVRIYLNGSNKA